MIDRFEDEDEEDWGPRLVDCVDEDGLRVFSGPCSTCIFRPGNKMMLQPGRVKGMVEDVVRDDSHTVCHKTLGDRPATLCHGMTKRHPGEGVRIFQRLGAIHLIEPPV